MDKIKARFVFLILIVIFFAGACHLSQSYAADANQTVSQPVNQAPAKTVSQPPKQLADQPAQECQEQDNTFWPWKMLMKLDAWVKKNLW